MHFANGNFTWEENIGKICLLRHLEVWKIFYGLQGGTEAAVLVILLPFPLHPQTIWMRTSIFVSFPAPAPFPILEISLMSTCA